MRRLARALWGCFAVVLAAGTAVPARAVPVPSTVQPGTIERSLQPSAPQRPQGPSVSIPPPEKLQAPSGANQIEFTVTAIDIDGATAISQQDLASAYSELLDRKITLADLYRAANAITAMYAERGYALSFAVVPAQQIENGRARIAVVEGFIAKITLENKNVPVPQQLADYAKKLLQSRPLKSEDLERYLLLANDIPGYAVRAVFDNVTDRFAERGATRLILHIERDRFAGNLTLDNRGSRALGPLRADGQYAFRGLLGLGEEFRVRGLWAYQKSEMIYGSFAASFPIFHEGGRLSSWISYSDTRPSVVLLGPGSFTGKSWVGHSGIELPLIRSRSDNLWLSTGFTAKRLDGDIFGVPNSRDRLYVIDASGTYAERDSSGATQFNLGLNQGLPIADATRTGSTFASRSAGSAVFATFSLSVSRDQVLWGPFDVLTTLSGQLASRPLLSSEQCGVGGAQFGRGFDDSEIAGDTCAMGSVELRYTPTADWTAPRWLFSQIQFYGFFDGGKVWRKGTLLPGEVRSESAMSTGGGIRFGFAFGMSLSAEYAKPLDRDISLEGNRHGRVFVTLSQAL